MKLPRKPVQRAVTAALGGLIPAVLEWAWGESHVSQLARSAAVGIAVSTCIASLCWMVLPRVSDRILRLPFAGKWISLVSLISLLAAVGACGGLLIAMVAGVFPAGRFWVFYLNALRTAVVITLGFALSLIFHEVLVGKLNRATAALKEKEQAEERLRQAATEARLSSLESRVHPHFLFNTLNSIGALIRENPVEAERMVERLAALLRSSLHANPARLVPLETELAVVRNYLEIEKVRFGTRLRYSIESDPALNGVEVPPFSIQTLVENSVKFAVSPRREGAEIKVRATLREGKPAIDVIDDGPGFSLADLKSGHGLDLLQSRLSAQFGPGSALEIGRDPDMTRVTVLI